MARTRMAGRALGCVIAIVAVLNGAGAFLRRVGVVEPERYRSYWSAHSGAPRGTCYFGPRAQLAYVYEAPGFERWLKLAKDMSFLALLVAGAASLLRREGMITRHALPAAALALCVALAAVLGLSRSDALSTAAGVRSMLFVPLALVSSAIPASTYTELGRWLAGLLAFEAALLPWELLRSVHLHGELPFLSLPRRLAGTFVMPNALGVAAALLVAFVLASGAGRRARLVAWFASGVLVLAAGSGTGVVLLAGLAFSERAHAAKRPSLVWLAAAACACAVPLLPRLLMRPTLFDGLFGEGSRLDAFVEATRVDVPTFLFGRGLGAGTNAAITAAQASSPVSPASLDAHGADSALLALFLQLGLVGVGLAALMVGAAWRRLPRWRPFLALACLASTTANVTEIFPVNLLLGLVLGAPPPEPAGGEMLRAA